MPLQSRGALPASTAYTTLGVSSGALNAVAVLPSQLVDGGYETRSVAAGDGAMLLVADTKTRSELES